MSSDFLVLVRGGTEEVTCLRDKGAITSKAVEETVEDEGDEGVEVQGSTQPRPPTNHRPD